LALSTQTARPDVEEVIESKVDRINEHHTAAQIH